MTKNNVKKLTYLKKNLKFKIYKEPSKLSKKEITQFFFNRQILEISLKRK